MRVVQTALEMGTGKLVQCFDLKTGEPELDDDFEQVYRFETASVDPRVLNKLLSLRMTSADGTAQTNVQVNTTVNELPRKPRLVGGSTGSVRRPLGASRASGAHPGVEVSEVIQGKTHETMGRSDD